MQKNIFQTRMDVNTISSVYERNVANLVKEAIAQENSGDIGVYYAKKEALTLPVAGVRFPTQLQQSTASTGNVAAAAFVDVPRGCCNVLSVKNVSAEGIDVTGANLMIERVA